MCYSERPIEILDSWTDENRLSCPLRIIEMTPNNFNEVLKISDAVLGKNYLTHEDCKNYWENGVKNKYRNSLIAEKNNKVVGFLFAFTPGNWKPDEFCSQKEWPGKVEEATYIKLMGVLQNYQRRGVGAKLLNKSIQIAKAQGAKFIVSHIWYNSPGEAPLRLFKKFGAREIKLYREKWYKESRSASWQCARCGSLCHCDSLEIVIKL